MSYSNEKCELEIAKMSSSWEEYQPMVVRVKGTRERVEYTVEEPGDEDVQGSAWNADNMINCSLATGIFDVSTEYQMATVRAPYDHEKLPGAVVEVIEDERSFSFSYDDIYILGTATSNGSSTAACPLSSVHDDVQNTEDVLDTHKDRGRVELETQNKSENGGQVPHAKNV